MKTYIKYLFWEVLGIIALIIINMYSGYAPDGEPMPEKMISGLGILALIGLVILTIRDMVRIKK